MDRFKDTNKAGIFGIMGNIFLLVIKAITGFISGSQAMIADAFNSASDIFASLMTFIGNKIASEPSDSSHNFGHGKAEYIFSMLISISMILIAIKLLIDSASSLLNGNELAFSWFLVLVCVITIFIKLGLYIYTKILNMKYSNILLAANMKDHRNDCIVTTFTLISVLLTLVGIYWFDGIVGIGISLWIFYTGLTIFIESYNVLMDISIDPSTRNKILDMSKKYEGIQRIDNIYSSPVGYKYMVVLTICVDGNMTTFDSHNIADNLEKDILKLETIESVIIHVNPMWDYVDGVFSE